MTDNFDIYAGQLVADGIDTTAPLIAFDKTGATTDLRVLDGIMGKIGKMVFKQPKIFTGPLDALFIKGSLPYGSASEIVSVIDATPNAKENGTCIPRGQVPITSQLNIANFAYAVDVEVKDTVLAKYVNDAGQLAEFVSMILSTPQKRIASLKYASQKHLVSNVIDGTRAITSDTKSDGSGDAVSYTSGTITGYCGKVEDVEYTTSTLDIAGAKDILDMVEDAYDQMIFENKVYSVSGNNDYLMGTPNIIIEKDLLRAMDRVLSGITATHPSTDETGSQRLGKIGNVVAIDRFDSIPVNVAHAGETIGVVITDPQMFHEDYLYTNMESERCVKQRLTGYSYRGESIFYADRSAPAYAVLMDKPVAP